MNGQAVTKALVFLKLISDSSVSLLLRYAKNDLSFNVNITILI